jgi:hypothetical protein
LLLLGTFVFASIGAGSGTAGACSCVQDSGTFDGRVVVRNGSGVTFLVESVQPNLSPSPIKVHAPPVAGHRVVVRYEHGEEQFLHIGRRYSVKVWWLGISGHPAQFLSSVAGGQSCCGGTTHLDGTTINKSPWLQPKVCRAAFAVAVAAVGIGALTGVLALRKRGRQARNVRQLRGSCS